MNVSQVISLSISFLIFVFFTSCNAFESSDNSIKSEDYAVYSTVLKEFAEDNEKTLLINEKTAFSMLGFFASDEQTPNEEELVNTLEGVYSNVDKSTIKDYVSKNLKPSILENKIELPVKYALFNKPKSKSVEELSNELYEKYPHSISGYINLSRVGFSKDRTEAFVSMEHMCLALCGGGDSFVLEKKNNVWKVKGVIVGWKS